MEHGSQLPGRTRNVFCSQYTAYSMTKHTYIIGAAVLHEHDRIPVQNGASLIQIALMVICLDIRAVR